MTNNKSIMFATVMIAIASVALMPLVTSDAFATNDTNNYVYNTPDGELKSSSFDTEQCLASVSNSVCESKLKVFNDRPSDKIRVYYNVQNAQCDVDIEWFKNGSSVSTWGTNSYTGTGAAISKFLSTSATDDWRADVSYSNCQSI